MRLLLFFAYNGALFYGSAPQPNRVTVIGAIQKALNKSGLFYENLTPSSRTDKDVHAKRQSLHVDITLPFIPEKLPAILNRLLPKSVRILSAQEVSSAFHARFEATSRVYRYILKPYVDVFEAQFVSESPWIDIEKFKKLTPLFEGVHDFSFFKKEGSVTVNNRREIYKAFAYEHQGAVIFYFKGNAFLRAQIRMMVGFMLGAVRLGLGEKELREQLACEVRHSSVLAPPEGLYLIRVCYNPFFNAF